MNDQLREIEQAEKGGEWTRVVDLRLRRYREIPGDAHNIRELIKCAEQSGQLPQIIDIAKSLDISEYHDLAFSLVVVRYAVMNMDFDWAKKIIDTIKANHRTNEWPTVAESEFLHKKGNTGDALNLLSKSLPDLLDTWAYLNISDTYYKILNENFSSHINVDNVQRGVCPPVLDALYVSLIKDEADIIYANLKHHYLVGFRQFIIMDNGSQDDSGNEVRRFQRDHEDTVIFLVEDPIVGYIQDTKTTAAMHFAVAILTGMNRTVRWVFPVDADEFICTSSGKPVLRDILQDAERNGKQVLTLVQINAASPSPLLEVPVGSEPLEIFTRRMAYPTLPVFKVGACYTADLAFEMGNHRPTRTYCELSKTAAAAELGAFMLHFPLRSVKHVRTKVLNGIVALDAAPHRTWAGGHWRRWHEQYLNKGEAFFQELLDEFVRSIGEHDDRRLASMSLVL